MHDSVGTCITQHECLWLVQSTRWVINPSYIRLSDVVVLVYNEEAEEEEEEEEEKKMGVKRSCSVAVSCLVVPD